MSELQQYYDSFNSGYWAEENPEHCRCRGSGWALSELDTWHQCPIHYKGQRHPEYEECSECGDGVNFSPLDCPHCGPALHDQLTEQGDVQVRQQTDNESQDNYEIPF